MNVSDATQTLKTQIVIGRTPKGRKLTDFAIASLTSCLNDSLNQGAEVTQCKNCGMVVSVLLIADGCPNCGGLDFQAHNTL